MAKNKNRPGYLALQQNGLLNSRAAQAGELLSPCRVCPQLCRVDRPGGELGLCRVGARARVASFGPHFGEEAPLTGQHGSGTIFFEGCNLLCSFCQNCDISHIDRQGDSSPQAVDDRKLAEIMINLQRQGCHNINLVTPSHVIPQFLAALPIAVERGLNIPIVYNCGGYDRIESLLLLDGVVDIYMPDCKFSTAETAALYTKTLDYPEVMRQAVKEMHRQVGDLVIEEGIARRGLLVRHLVMPGLLEETRGVLEFLAGEIGPNTYINIMDQYRPCHLALDQEPINRPLAAQEYEQALAMAEELGLRRLDRRDMQGLLRQLLGL